MNARKLFTIVLTAGLVLALSGAAQGAIVEFEYTQTDSTTGSGTITGEIGGLTFTGAMPTATVIGAAGTDPTSIGSITQSYDNAGNPGPGDPERGVYLGWSGTVTLSATSGPLTLLIDVPLVIPDPSGTYYWEITYRDYYPTTDAYGEMRAATYPGDYGEGHRHSGDWETINQNQADSFTNTRDDDIDDHSWGDDLGILAGFRDGSLDGGSDPLDVDTIVFGGELIADDGTLRVQGGGTLTWDGTTGAQAQWGYGEGTDSHWNGGAAGDIPELDDAAIVGSGEVAVEANRGAWSLDVTGGSVTIDPTYTLTILSNTTVESTGTITIDGTLDTGTMVGGITIADGGTVAVNSGGSLTAGDDIYLGTDNDSSDSGDSGFLVTSGTVFADDDIRLWDSSVLTVLAGDMRADDDIRAFDDSAIVVNGGILRADDDIRAFDDSAIVVNGGILRADDDIILEDGAITVTVNGGVFRADDEIKIYHGSVVTVTDGGTIQAGDFIRVRGEDALLVVIDGGTVVGEIQLDEDGSTLELNSTTAVDVVTLSNYIDGRGSDGIIRVIDNPGVDTDWAVLSGNLEDFSDLNKQGDGLLVLSGTVRVDDDFTVEAGTVYVTGDLRTDYIVQDGDKDQHVYVLNGSTLIVSGFVSAYKSDHVYVTGSTLIVEDGGEVEGDNDVYISASTLIVEDGGYIKADDDDFFIEDGSIVTTSGRIRADDDIEINDSTVTVNVGGRFYTEGGGDDIRLYDGSEMVVNGGEVFAADDIRLYDQSTLTVYGGIVHVTGDDDNIEVHNSTLTVNGGEVYADDDMKIYDGSTVVVNSGGLIETGDVIRVRDSDLTVDGGTLIAGALEVDYDGGAGGVLEIIGSGGSINVAEYEQVDGTVLSFILDAGGLTTINVDGPVSLDGELWLDLTLYTGALADLVLIDNDGLDPIAGTLDLTTVIGGPAGLSLVYTGGDGNDLTLLQPDIFIAYNDFEPSTDMDWNLGTTWVPGTAPTDEKAAYVRGNLTVTATETTDTAFSLTIGPSAVGGGGPGTVIVESSKVLTIVDDVNVTSVGVGSMLDVDGTLIVGGDLNVTAGTLDVAGTLTAAGDLSVTIGAIVKVSGTISVASIDSDTMMFTFGDGGTLEVGAGGGDLYRVASSAPPVLDATWTIDNEGDVNINGTTPLIVGHDQTFIKDGSGELTLDPDNELFLGTIQVIDGEGSGGTIAVTGTGDMTAESLTMFNTVLTKEGSGTLNFTTGQNTLFGNNTVVVSAGELSMTSDGTSPLEGAELELSGGTFTVIGSGDTGAPDGAVGRWLLNEGSGTTAADSSGESNDGTLTNMESGDWVEGRSGEAGDYALAFDGDNDHVDLGNPGELDFGTGDFTVSAWVNTSVNEDEEQAIFSKGGNWDSGDRPGIRYSLNIDDGDVGIRFSTDDDEGGSGDNKNKVNLEGDITITDGDWHHVVGVREGNELRIYVDGVLDGTKSLGSGTYDLDTSDFHAFLGAIDDASEATQTLESFYTGLIDEVYAYDFALTDDQLDDLFAANAIVAAVDMSDTDVTVELGSTGSVINAANEGTIFGDLVIEAGADLTTYRGETSFATTYLQADSSLTGEEGGVNTGAATADDGSGLYGELIIPSLHVIGEDVSLEGGEYGDLTMDADTSLILVYEDDVEWDNITAGDGATITGNVTVVTSVTVATGIGTLTIAGDYTQADGSSYVWEVGDEIHVSNDLLLEDTWDLNIQGTYLSSPGERHTLFTYGDDLDFSAPTLTEGSPNVFTDFATVGNDEQAQEVYLEGLLITGDPGELLIWDGTQSSKGRFAQEATWSFIEGKSGESHWSTDGTPATRVDYIPTLDRVEMTGHQVQIRGGDVTVKHNVGAYSLDITNDGTLLVQQARTLEILTRVNVADSAGLQIDGTLDAFAIYNEATTVLGQSGTLKVYGGAIQAVTTLKIEATIDVGLGTLTATDLNLAPDSDFIKQGAGKLSFTSGINTMDDSNTIKVTGGELEMQAASDPLNGAELELTGSTFTVIAAAGGSTGAPDGAVATWLFNDGAGGTLADSAGSNITGALTNMDPNTDWVAGRSGQAGDYALEFDADDDQYVDLGNPSELDFGTGDFTVSAWVMRTGYEDDEQIIFAKGGNNDDGIRYEIEIDNGSNGELRFITDDDENKETAGDSTGMSSNVWHHVVGIRDGDEIRLYVDGVLVDTDDNISEGRPDYDLATSGWKAYIGAIADNEDAELDPEKFFTGFIDEIYVYGFALDDDQLDELFAAAAIVAIPPVDMSGTDVTIKLDDSGSVINSAAGGTIFGDLLIEHNADLTVRGGDITFAAAALDHHSTLTTEGGYATFDSIELKTDSLLIVGEAGADLGELTNSFIATIEVLGEANAISDGLKISNTLTKTGTGTLTITGGQAQASANLNIDDGRLIIVAAGLTKGNGKSKKVIVINPLDKARVTLSGGELALTTSAETTAEAPAIFDNPITVTADSSLTAGAYAGYADGLEGEQYVQVGSRKNPLSIAEGSTLTLGTTDDYTLTVAGEVHSGNMTVDQGTVQTTGGGSVANLTVSGGSLTVENSKLTIDAGGTLAIGDTSFHGTEAFKVTGKMTATSAENIILSGGTVTASLAAPPAPEPEPVRIALITDYNEDSEDRDAPYVNFLESQGYEVEAIHREYRDLDSTKIAHLENDFDVVIVSRHTGSGNYDDGDEEQQWNGLDVPLILNSAYLARNNRWDWLDGGLDGPTVTDIDIIDAGHPIMDGFSSPITFYDAEKLNVVATNNNGNGNVILALSSGRIVMAEWDKGEAFYSGAGEGMAGNLRLLFCLTEYDKDDQEWSSISSDGLELIIRSVEYATGTMGGPPPVDMSDVHFSLVEGTSTTLDLTGVDANGVVFGAPLPLTWHPGNLSAYLTLEGAFDDEDDFKSGWLWDLAGDWALLEDENDDNYILWNPLDSDDWEWDGGALVGSVTMEFTPMPEPGTMLLLGFGALGILLKKRRRS